MAIIVRNVFQAKYGRGGELVAHLKELQEKWPDYPGKPPRLMTDISGQFFTVVTEADFDNLAAYERLQRLMFSRPEFNDWFQRMVPLVDSGRREFYNLEP